MKVTTALRAIDVKVALPSTGDSEAQLRNIGEECLREADKVLKP